MKAFVEIRVKAGYVGSVLSKVRRIEHVKEATAVLGHCEIVATVEAPNLEALTESVLKEIQNVESVTRTETLVCTTPPSMKKD